MSEYMFPALKEAQGKLDAVRKTMGDVFREAGPEMDLSKVKAVEGDDAAKLAFIRNTNEKELPALKKRVEELRAVAEAAGGDYDVKESGADEGRKPEFKSLGDAIVESQAIKGYQIGSGNGPSAHIDIDMKANFLRTAGWDPFDPRTGRVQLTALRPAPLVFPWFSQTTTQFSTVKYMEETTFTNTGAEIDEAGAYQEAALALTERSSEVRKVGVFLPFSDEQVEDEPRSRDYINNRLMYMLQAKVDAQLLLGSGTGTPTQLLGTENVASINTQALGADNVPDAIYKAIRQVRATGFSEPSVVFIPPAKWEAVRLLKSANGDYIWGHPALPGPETIWGVPVQLTTAGTSTKAYVGDYVRQAEISMRRGVDVQVTNSHASFFTTGLQAIRADLRLAVIHYRPTAFTVVTGL